MEQLYNYLPRELITFVLVTLFSLLIGLSQRRISLKREGETTLFGTDRTFTFIGILGYLLYILDPTDMRLFMGGGAVLGLLLGLNYYVKQSQFHVFGVTTIIIALITYCLAPIVSTQPSWFYVMVIVTVLLLTELKHTFTEFAQRMKNDEMITLAKFLAISGIILPMLPHKNLIPDINLTPYSIWLATVVVSGISYLSYLLKRYVFHESGVLVSGIIGGLYSSTATISVLARKSRKASEQEANEYVAAMLLAVSMMLGVLAMPASAAAQQPESTAAVSEELPDAAALSAAEDENDIVNIRIRATGNLVYGSDYKLEVETRPENTQYIAVVLGTSGEAYGYVTLMISDKLRTLLKLIPLPKKMSQTPDQAEEFNVYSYLKQLIDGNDVGVLLRVADEVVSVMDTVSFFVPASYLTTVKNVSNGMKLTLSLIRKYLPEGALSRIYLDEQPKDSGKYVAGAIALESSDINAAGFAMFKIKPKTENVSLSWAADAPSSMTVSQLQNADLTAKVISDGQVAENGKVSYTYKKKTFLCFSSKINGVPTEPGTYTQTAKAGGNYSCGSISRTITVTADPQPAAEQSAEQAAEQPAA